MILAGIELGAVVRNADGGASLSRDGGATWTKVGEGLDRHYAVACAADSDRPETWYISVSPGPGRAHAGGDAAAYIYRIREGGPWVKLTGGLPQPLDWMPYGLATVRGRTGLVIAALKNGEVWASEDSGDARVAASGRAGPWMGYGSWTAR